MKILITGTGGMIGGSLLKYFLKFSHHHIIATFRKNTPPNLGADRVRCIQKDLSLKCDFDESVDYIIHCSANSDFKNNPVDLFLNENISITRNLSNYAKEFGIKGVIHLSSIEIHGKIQDSLVHKDTDIVNPTPYGMSKKISELILEEYQVTFPSLSLRLCGVIGPSFKNVWLTRVAQKIMAGEDIPIVNGHRPFNNAVHIQDLSQFINQLILKGFQLTDSFPIASTGSATVLDVVGEMISAAGTSSKIIDNGNTDNSFIISSDYAIETYGYEPSHILENVGRYISECKDE